MPLIPSGKPAAVSTNIRTEISAGKPRRQAIAIALHTADQANRGPKRKPFAPTKPQ